MANLTPAQRIRIVLEFIGSNQYISRMNAAAVSTYRQAKAEERLAATTKLANERTFFQNQLMYTARRYAFYATLGITALAFSVVRLGLSYYNTTQTAMVGFTGLLHSQRLARRELDYLYILAAKTPFQFTDLVNAARLLQPYTKNLSLTNQVVKDLTNTLSAAGQLSASAMQRAALQLSHMFTIGRLTGQILLALGRDFVPMNLALQQSLHMTGEQIRQQVAGGFITAKIAAKALHDYIMADRGRSMAGFNQATKTLVGSWSTLKDLIGMSASSSSGGIFEGIRKTIKAIDTNLLAVTDKRHLRLFDLIEAMDRTMTPHTHAIVNLFLLISTAIKTTVTEMYLLFSAVGYLLRPLDYLGSMFGANRLGAKLLGIVIGTVTTVLIINKMATIANAEAKVFAAFVERAYGKSLLFSRRALMILTLLYKGEALASLRRYIFATKTATVWNEALGKSQTRNVFVNNGKWARMARGIWGVVVATYAWAAANTALLVTIGIWFAIGVALFILYKKWGTFHKAVNDLWRDIIIFSPIIAAALTYAFGPIGAAVMGLLLLIRYWDKVKNFGGLVKPATPQEDHNIRTKGTWWNIKHDVWQQIPHPGLATGGNVTRGGLVTVGERGPELLSLPTGASVTPLTPMQNVQPRMMLKIDVHPQDIYMDGHKVGYVISTAAEDKEARS